MGGAGSGPVPTGSSLLRVHECLSLSISRLRKAGVLGVEGTASTQLCWSDEQGHPPSARANVTVIPGGAGGRVVRLQYAVAMGKVREEVTLDLDLTTTTLYCGGRRWWFACPSCGRQVGTLYLPPGQTHFACRHCHDLRYRRTRTPAGAGFVDPDGDLT